MVELNRDELKIVKIAIGYLFAAIVSTAVFASWLGLAGIALIWVAWFASEYVIVGSLFRMSLFA